MRNKKLIGLLIFLLFLCPIYIKGCSYLPINGTVIDEQTGQPIEGAIVLAQWTITKGTWMGLPSTEPYKVFETITGKDGKFEINAIVLRPLINKPDLTVYKPGYVCWNSKYIFPGLKHREGYKWKSNRKYQLERFKNEYSYVDHVSFIRYFVISSTKYFENAFRWEELMEQKELRGVK